MQLYAINGIILSLLELAINFNIYIYVCVCERERERERECVITIMYIIQLMRQKSWNNHIKHLKLYVHNY